MFAERSIRVIRVTLDTLGNLSEMMISSNHFSSGYSSEPYSIEKILDKITKGMLAEMLIHLKEHRGRIKERSKRNYTIYEDICILALFKINQHLLCHETIVIISKKLEQLLNRTEKSIQSRYYSLQQHEYQLIHESMRKCYDIVIRPKPRGIKSWIKQWKHNHKDIENEYFTERGKKPYLFFISHINLKQVDQRNKIKYQQERLSQNKIKYQSERLSQNEMQEINELFQLIEKRNICLRNAIDFDMSSSSESQDEINQQMGDFNINLQQTNITQKLVGRRMANTEPAQQHHSNQAEASARQVLLLFQESPLFHLPQSLNKEYFLEVRGEQHMFCLREVLHECKKSVFQGKLNPDDKEALEFNVRLLSNIYKHEEGKAKITNEGLFSFFRGNFANESKSHEARDIFEKMETKFGVTQQFYTNLNQIFSTFASLNL